MHSLAWSRLSLLPLLLLAAGCGSADAADDVVDEPAYTDGARVSFTTQAWDPNWIGTPRAGGKVHIDYDFGRVPQCRNQSRLVSWVVEVNYRFDGGPTTTVALPGSPGTAETLPASGIAIPPGANSLELWFENRAVGGYDHCEMWDSRYGQNYTHAIAR